MTGFLPWLAAQTGRPLIHCPELWPIRPRRHPEGVQRMTSWPTHRGKKRLRRWRTRAERKRRATTETPPGWGEGGAP